MTHSTDKNAARFAYLRQEVNRTSMDLVTQLLVSKNGNDCIVVFVDRSTKMAHLSACKTTILSHEIADLLIKTDVFTSVTVCHLPLFQRETPELQATCGKCR